jgi:hypothetical protein
MLIFPRNIVIFLPTLDLAIDAKTKKGVLDLSVSNKSKQFGPIVFDMYEKASSRFVLSRCHLPTLNQMK